ncbi:MAG: ABC transporter ATP-binding protein [Planctomycetaceae bacterium]|nr:ABC transporter ATP-binding protein [Planctomycetaceae bacterium]
MPSLTSLSTETPLLTLSDVVLEGGQQRRLDHISLQIGTGRTAIVGLSGAGKTSLLNVLAGFEAPTDGRLTLGGQPSNHRLFRYWVPQNGGLWPHICLIDHLTFVIEQAADSEIRKKSDEILGAFDLRHRANAFPDELSQGERSRLALARALMANPQVLLADEPLAHVDIVRKPEFWKAVDDWIDRSASSLIFSSHEPEVVRRHADRVIVMEQGSVIFDGSVTELYDNPPDERSAVFLGPINWLTAERLSDLGIQQQGGDCGIRPERITLSESHSGQCVVVQNSPSGYFQETRLQHVTNGFELTVIHRGLRVLSPRTRVSITIDRISDA